MQRNTENRLSICVPHSEMSTSLCFRGRCILCSMRLFVCKPYILATLSRLIASLVNLQFWQKAQEVCPCAARKEPWKQAKANEWGPEAFRTHQVSCVTSWWRTAVVHESNCKWFTNWNETDLRSTTNLLPKVSNTVISSKSSFFRYVHCK